MEIIAKISKGSRMDQVYLPKKRSGLRNGSYVLIKQLEQRKVPQRLYAHQVASLEPIKVEIIKRVMAEIQKRVAVIDNIFIVGSFLYKGFHFNDIDIIIVTEEIVPKEEIKKTIQEELGIQAHLMVLTGKILRKGLETDPLYVLMLSSCIAKKRFLYKTKREINYKLLDLHLIKSKVLLDSIDILNGSEKYYLTRNLIAIRLFIQRKKIDRESVDREIKKLLRIPTVRDLKENKINKKVLLTRYRAVYKNTLAMIMQGIQDGAKQK